MGLRSLFRAARGISPGLLRLRLATTTLLAMTGGLTFYEFINDGILGLNDRIKRKHWLGFLSHYSIIPSSHLT